MTKAPGHERLFLIDGVGALATLTLLLTVVAPFESTFGMPPKVIYPLAFVAGVFAIYALTCFFFAKDNRQKLLNGIAVANVAYCLLTMLVLLIFWREITVLGAVYFAIEIAVVLVLSVYELKSSGLNEVE